MVMLMTEQSRKSRIYPKMRHHITKLMMPYDIVVIVLDIFAGRILGIAWFVLLFLLKKVIYKLENKIIIITIILTMSL